MKPLEGRYQTAMQMKGFSPVSSNIKEVDSVHLLEDSRNCLDMVRDSSLFRGLRPWYDIEWRLQELGRSQQFPILRIFVNNPKKGGDREDCWEVGLTHSRGVAGVMPCESIAHSKGSAVLCRGKGKHGQYKETKGSCRQN